jgi:hypothetical protein
MMPFLLKSTGATSLRNCSTIPRRCLGASVRPCFSDNFLAFGAPSEDMLATLAVLAGDSKWEVCRRVAELLAILPDEAFNRLAARVTEDQNSYVRKAAERLMDRRRRGEKDALASGRRSG